MRRREFITMFGGAATWSLAAQAQQPDKMRRVGVLAYFNEKDPDAQVNLAAFKKRLVDLGWTEGLNLAIDYRFTNGSTEQIRAAAEDLVATAPDVIFASSNVSVAPQRQRNGRPKSERSFRFVEPAELRRDERKRLFSRSDFAWKGNLRGCESIVDCCPVGFEVFKNDIVPFNLQLV